MRRSFYGWAMVAAACSSGPTPVDAMQAPVDAMLASCDVDHGGCDLNATCDASSGSVVCTCLPGFAGDGRACAEVATGLHGLRWELPCETDLSAEICTCPVGAIETAQLGGVSGTTYDVTMRFRGAVEQKTYFDGLADGYWLVGGTPTGEPYNVYRLDVSDPPQTFHLNAGLSGNSHLDVLDYTRTVAMAAGATVTLTADPIDTEQVQNRDVDGNPIVVPGVPPAPLAFDGQFLQLDVVSITAQ